MESSRQLAQRFREVTLSGRWIANTNFQDQLRDLNWEIATIKVHSLNTIADLTQHVDYYVTGLIKAFKDETLTISDKFSFGFPMITSQDDWQYLKTKFLADAENFAVLIMQLPDGKLETIFFDEQYGTYRRNINAMIEHCYYHLGQIVLIRKIIDRS